MSKDLYDLAKKYDFSEICITSHANTILDENAKDNIEVKTSKANGKNVLFVGRLEKQSVKDTQHAVLNDKIFLNKKDFFFFNYIINFHFR